MYDRYATELTDKENRIYGVMDSEAREELSSVKSAINDIEVIIPSETLSPASTIIQSSLWIVSDGIVSSTTGEASFNRRSEPVAIEPTDEVKITINSRLSSTDAAIFVVDAEYHLLYSDNAKTSAQDLETFEFKAPASSAFMMWNQYQGDAPTLFTIKRYKQLATDEDVQAIDERVDALEDFNDGLLQNTSETSNLLDYREVVEGVIDNTGAFVPEGPSTYKDVVTGFIPVKPGQTYFFKNLNGNNATARGYYYYDSDKSFISGETGSSTVYWSNFTAPNNAKYIRLYKYIGKDYGTSTIQEYYRQTFGFFEYGRDSTGEQFVPASILQEDYRDDFLIDTRSFKGKTIAILGDSIGTRQGYNDPEILITEDDVGVELSAYVTYNDVGAGLSIAGTTYTDSDIGTEVTFTPTAEDVGKSIGVPLNHGGADAVRWWQMLCKKLGMNAVNASWSGTTMVSLESQTNVRKNYWASCAWYVPTIRRCGIRTPGTMTRKAPDYIFIHRGVNDFSNEHSGAATVLTDGLFTGGRWVVPQTDQVTVDNTTKYGFKEAYAMTIQKLRDAYPKAKIICCTIAPFRRHSETYYPPYNGRYQLTDFNKAIREVAEFFDCPVCEFAQVYPYERLSYFTGDYTHPNEYGHRAMYEKALLCLANNKQFNG